MENASKALLIAGGILIAILIVCIAIYLYNLYSNQANEYSDIISSTELQKFNSKFDVYIGRNNIKPQEVASVMNLAREYNNIVNIKIYNKGYSVENFSTPEGFIVKYLNSTFSCVNYKYNENTGAIIELNFKEN